MGLRGIKPFFKRAASTGGKQAKSKTGFKTRGQLGALRMRKVTG